MQYLIDTHTFLWFVEDAPELSPIAKTLIEDENNEIFISIASLWEISIKTAIGKLSISGNYETVIDDVVDNSIEILPINFAHTVMQNKLPFHHRDPFDRIIISQAIVENIDFISAEQSLTII
jgi:PIN domain nuclease of toxin-antitoxin system